ncbi:MAG TPA: DUF1326 domain-containing protein [Actinomycetospora sp.]|nr:DUF1326 domain-containing protein [Actinomycetospora sp.]
MAYLLRGLFIEACDCFELCPCWVDDDPDEGHCTGVVAWRMEDGSYIDDVDVADRKVVAVTTHGGRRRPAGAKDDPRLRASTSLFVDDEADDREVEALARAFTGKQGGGLSDLVQVTGRVVGDTRKAPIQLKDGKAWSISVGPSDAAAVDIRGDSLAFDEAPNALTLNHTALHKELRIEGTVEAKRSSTMSLNVPALGGSGYVEAKARSGMSGKFCYEQK